MIRITEGQLRRIIREALLAEGAMTPQDAKRERLHFKIKKRDKFAEIEVYSPHSEKWIGILLSTAEDEPWRGRAACSGAWTIEGSQAKIDGLGPLMYDLMIDVVHPHPLASDRAEVTPSAQRVWDYYHDRRPDIESMQLDDLRNTLWRTTTVSSRLPRSGATTTSAMRIAGLSPHSRRPTGAGAAGPRRSMSCRLSG